MAILGRVSLKGHPMKGPPRSSALQSRPKRWVGLAQRHSNSLGHRWGVGSMSPNPQPGRCSFSASSG